MENIVALQNPWKRGQSALKDVIISRKITPKIEIWLDQEEIVIIKGARQAGKTTIIYCIIDQLLRSGVKPERIFYFLLDNRKLQEEFSRHPYALKNAIETFLGSTIENYPDRLYLFLDEAQKFPDFANIVKEYFDLLKNVKIILSGSSILQLSRQVSESLRGRTVSFTVEPFSVTETVPSVETIPMDDLTNFDRLKQRYAAVLPFQNEIQVALNKQFVFGALPRIFLSETNEQRQFRLEEYVQTLIQRDIIETLKVAKYLDFENMLRLLSFQAGQVVNISNLATDAKLSSTTIRRYLSIAEETFVLDRLPPFFSNKRKGLIKDQKIYFRDSGLRNHLCRKATTDLLTFPNLGFEAENFVHITINKLISNTRQRIAQYFFRSYSGQEVDFVLEMNGKLLPIEVKFQEKLAKKDFKNLVAFMRDEDIETGFIVTKNRFESRRFDEKNIIILPLWFMALIA